MESCVLLEELLIVFIKTTGIFLSFAGRGEDDDLRICYVIYTWMGYIFIIF